MDKPVVSYHRRRIYAESRAVIAADPATGLLDQQHTRGHVPRIQALFPHAVKASAGDVCEVDSCRSVAPDATRFEQKSGQVSCKILAPFEVVWKSGDDQGVAEILRLRHAYRFVIQ